MAATGANLIVTAWEPLGEIVPLVQLAV